MRVWLAILLAATGVAGEEDAVRVRLADAAPLIAHLSASPFAPLLTDNAFHLLREEGQAWLRRTEANSQSGIALALPTARGMQFRLLDPEADPEPRWAVQADLGHQAPRFARGMGVTWLDATPTSSVEADEAWMDGSERILARFAGLVAYGYPATALPLPPLPSEADLAIDVAPAALARAVAVVHGRDLLPTGRWTALSYRLKLVPEGLHWQVSAQGPTVGLRPVDRALFARLPATTCDATLLGLDGPAWWQHHGAGLDRPLAELGIGGGLRALVEACTGTVLFAIGPGAPFPSLTLALPRSPALDRLVEDACRHLGGLPPGEGAAQTVNVPDLPVVVLVAREATHWVFSTDALTVQGWRNGGPNFAATPACRQLLEQAPADASLVGAGDATRSLPAILAAFNLLIGPEDWQQHVQRGLPVLANLPPSRRWAVATADRFLLEGRGGDLIWGLAPALAAAVILPDLLDSRQTVNEAAVAGLLRSGIFPAQVQFQGAAILDVDQDGVGEYGLLSELAGRRAVGDLAAGGLRLLDGDLRQGDVAHGYRFAIHVPDHTGAVIGEPPGKAARPVPLPPAVAPDRDDRECFWIAYAWPETPAAGKHLYVVDMTGQVRRLPWDGRIPAWNALYGGKGWEEPPHWPIVPRRRR